MGLPDKQMVANSVILEKDSRISLRMEKLEMSRNSRKREHRGITTM